MRSFHSLSGRTPVVRKVQRSGLRNQSTGTSSQCFASYFRCIVFSRVRQKFLAIVPPTAKPSVSTTFPASFQWEFEPICASIPRAQTPIQISNVSTVLAKHYDSNIAQADFCALSSAHLPLPGHNRIDCRGIRRQIMKYRQIVVATPPLHPISRIPFFVKPSTKKRTAHGAIASK